MKFKILTVMIISLSVATTTLARQHQENKATAMDVTDALASPGWDPATRTGKKADMSLNLDQVLAQIEKHYAQKTVCLDFSQKATLAQMGVTDRASGEACFQPPDLMRWQYKSPEEQLVVTDGDTLWVWRPVDNQVMIGKAADWFGDGKGASFFSNITALKEQFNVSFAGPEIMAQAAEQGCYALKLSPKKARPEFTRLYLLIDAKNFNVKETRSYNDFGDVTVIRFKQPRFVDSIPHERFTFKPPLGASIIRMEKNKTLK